MLKNRISWPCLPMIILVAIISRQSVQSANILFFFGVSTYSHRIVVWPLVEKLAEQGHDVTFVQSFPPKKPHPKVKEFYPKESAGVGAVGGGVNLLNGRLEQGRYLTGMNLLKDVHILGVKMCEAFLIPNETRAWVKESKFDLIIIDGLLNDCGLGLAHKFKAKTIIFGTTHPFPWYFDSFGILPETSTIPELLVSFPYPMSFFQRVASTLLYLGLHYYKQNHFNPELSQLFHKTLDLPESLDVGELERQTSLILTNTHFSEESARSLPPLVVPVGGIHCGDSSQSLSKDLKEFIEGSGSNGFIYVSFGSTAQVSQAPKYFQEMFYKALANSKLRFVWKFEGERTKDIPNNVFVDKWMPQQAILAHPKIKAFLTHGGLLGIQEAIWHGVPLISMPIFAEQDYNSFRLQRTHRGIMLDPNTLTQDKLEEAILMVTTDPKYKDNMEKLSRRFKDRPATPLDTALWWTEYVLRNDDLSSLKPLSIHQSWYERRLVDVWGFIFFLITLVFISITFVLKLILKSMVSKCSGSNSAKNTNNKKKKKQ